jgi:RNA polymerase sigma factor (sigma-70 family)
MSLSSPFGEVAAMEDISVLPEEMLEQVEKRSAVRAAIIALPDDRREVLLKKYVDGLSTETIATHMGRTVKAVESLLSRTREQMRVLLRGYMMPCGDRRRVSKESSNE